MVRVDCAQGNEPGVRAAQGKYPGVGRNHLVRAQGGGEAERMGQAGAVQVLVKILGRAVSGRTQSNVPPD